MRPVRMKKWVRVGIPLLLACLVSLAVVGHLYKRNITTSSRRRDPHRARLQQALDGLQRIRGHGDGVYKLTGSKSKTSKGITLAVVEEHHEVIPYWFKAAKMGIIPKRGNTLIHIDGHSDIGAPVYHPKMPFFRWPKTDNEMYQLMQANDVFIQAAIIAGLISRFIFIYPSWDKNENTTYAVINIDVGSLTFNNSKEPTICCCMFVPGEGKRQCMYVDQLAAPAHGGGGSDEDDLMPIISDRLDSCKFHRHCRGEQVVDHAVLEMLKTKRDWLGLSGNILLDIDEDYFGVQLPGQYLLNAGLNWTMVMQLQETLQNMFCPKQINHEGIANRMMRQMIGSIISRCRPFGSSGHRKCRLPVANVQTIVRNTALSYWKRQPQLLCARKTKRLFVHSNALTLVLYKFKLDHLTVLMEFGFCLETTPASIAFRNKGFGSIGLCIGTNTPNDYSVFLHTPDAAEIHTRTTQLRKILEIIDDHHRPSLVTLCRSVRDGYTPRSYFRTIETNILDIFTNLPGNYDVAYDKNLYGGKGGWPDRHKNM